MPSARAPIADDPLQECCERVCGALVEAHWRGQPGLALRIGCDAPGVVERPGRTRFDLRWEGAAGYGGLLRARAPELPFCDGCLSLLVLDRLALPARLLRPLLQEAMRVLADDGRLLLVDYSRWGWLGWRRRWRGERAAAGPASIARWLRAAGFEEVGIERALRIAPLPRRLAQRLGASFERGHGWPLPASVQALSARKRSSNVIAIPFARDRRQPLLAAPEGMRRAG